MKIVLAESAGFSPAALALLRRHGQVAAADLDRAGLVEAVRDCDVLWVRLRHQVDAEVLDAAPRLKVIVTNTTGLNHIDAAAARQRGIEVLSLAGETEFLRDVRATAELTIGLMLALARQIPAAVQHARAGGWNRDLFVGGELHRKAIGIVGFGRLGRIVARYLQAFDAKVLATPALDAQRRDDKESLHVTFVRLEELLPQCDIVSIHVDLNDTTRGMFNRRVLSQMKSGAFLVNTSRGEVIDEDALLSALESGKLAGAALDVLADEQRLQQESRPLVEYARTHNHLLLTPHIGGNTLQSREKTELFLAEKLAAKITQLGKLESANR
jgi:D-3-phosphoglycerate dehydrogenase